MKVVNIQEAKTHLSRLIEKVAMGEELVLGKAGKPMAKLVPYKPSGKVRKLGTLAGKLQEDPSAWSKETDKQIAETFLRSGEELPGNQESSMTGQVAEPIKPYPEKENGDS